MELRRLSAGDWLGAAGGVLLIVSLFLPWYEAGGQSVNAWESMAINDVLLLITGAVAVGAAFVVAGRRLSGLSVAATSLAILPAVVSVVLVTGRLIWPAPDADVSLGAGAWLGLVAALATAVGAWKGATDEGPARRNPAAERRATEEGLARSELLDLNAPLQK